VLEIDHVVMAVGDLEEAADRLFREHGLASVVGGRHTGMGTANRVVPLGSAYLELIAVVDDDEAATSPMGRWVRSATAGGDRWGGWVVRPGDIEAEAARLGLDVMDGARERPDGTVLRWRMAGVGEAAANPPLPFFIEWRVAESERPGRADAAHRVRPLGIARLDVAGDRDRMRDWLGEDLPNLRVVPGPPGIVAVVVATEDGDLVLR
jgi:hypothetical protein